MLFPQTNSYRNVFDLSGFWQFCFDPENIGRTAQWAHGFTTSRPIAVPASWNDQFEEGRDYLGDAWYQTTFDLPRGFDPAQQTIYLRFGSVNYLAEVWLNGHRLGIHEGGHLAFQFDVTGQLQPEANLLVVRVNGELSFDRVPPGNIAPELTASNEHKLPNAAFDFFPFCGLHRPVLLYAQPQSAFEDITVKTDINNTEGIVHVRWQTTGSNLKAQIRLHGHGVNTVIETNNTDTTFTIPQAALWEPGAPNLYDLTLKLWQGDQVIDQYALRIGIRTIRVEGDHLLLNNKPVYLKGFGRHEDFPIMGRGYMPAVIVKDYALLKWVNANSFRTSHYPYAEQMMDLADELGFLVIDETAAVGLFFAEQGLNRRLELCRQFTQELIDRDKNHPSVIAWSLANEPTSNHPQAKPFFRNLYDLARSLDDTRPITIVSHKGVNEESFEFLDFMCLNRYYGWYTDVGQIETGAQHLSAELDALYQKFHKPLVFTEFGADTYPGHHALPPEMFSEEYQIEMIKRDIEILREKKFVAGEHIWNMCDFKTSQGIKRMNGFNYKGVFTRDRRPKMAAYYLRELWGKT